MCTQLDCAKYVGIFKLCSFHITFHITSHLIKYCQNKQTNNLFVFLLCNFQAFLRFIVHVWNNKMVLLLYYTGCHVLQWLTLTTYLPGFTGVQNFPSSPVSLETAADPLPSGNTIIFLLVTRVVKPSGNLSILTRPHRLKLKHKDLTISICC